MGAVKLITNAYSTLNTTAGLKTMWLLVLGADALFGFSMVASIRDLFAQNPPFSTLAPVLLLALLFVGKAYAEFAAYRLLSELPVVPLSEVEALSHLSLLARVWTICFLTLGMFMLINVAVGAMLVMSLIFGVFFGLFAFLFLQIPYFDFIDKVTSPFMGFFNIEGKLLGLVHVSANAAIAFCTIMFTGLFLAPVVMAIIVLARRDRLRPAPEQPTLPSQP